ncbi:MAG: hypothetical protein LBC19_16565 [Tannerella sp.]|jgi:hypothetical protein|nr:hypothetical protein [Tannerella sp.]
MNTKKKNTVKKTLCVISIILVMAAGIALSVLLTKLYINSGWRAVIFYRWIPIPMIAFPALIPFVIACVSAVSIKDRLWRN